MNTTAATRVERDVIRVSGSEAVAYLQGQISQDVDAVAVDASAWSLVLQPTGKIDAWLRMHRVATNEFLFDLDVGHGEAAIARLERFRLRTDVSFDAELGWAMVRLTGPAAPAHPVDSELTAEVRWPGFDGVDHLGPDVRIPDGIPVLGAVEYEARRIAAGWPRMGSELTTDTIPAEAGDPFISSSVSFTKGCFTGQELVARIDSRGGNVPRPIRVLVGPRGSVLEAGATVELDGRDVGKVTSTAGVRPDAPGLALATVLRRVEPGTDVVVEEVTATVRVAPVPPDG